MVREVIARIYIYPTWVRAENLEVNVMKDPESLGEFFDAEMDSIEELKAAVEAFPMMTHEHGLGEHMISVPGVNGSHLFLRPRDIHSIIVLQPESKAGENIVL